MVADSGPGGRISPESVGRGLTRLVEGGGERVEGRRDSKSARVRVNQMLREKKSAGLALEQAKSGNGRYSGSKP